MLSPDAKTPDVLRFIEGATHAAATLEAALRPLGLPAAYTMLMFVLRPERTHDGNVHWRYLDKPTFEFEQGQITLPTASTDSTSETASRVFQAVARAVLLRMADLRGWEAAALAAAVPRDAVDGLPVTVIFDAEPAVSISTGGGPTNDPRTHPYLQRNHEHGELFQHDNAWYGWWLATGRAEVDVAVTFEGKAGLRVSVSERRILLARTQPPDSIPVDTSAARALADRDVCEALDRLVKRLRLEPYPPLR